MLQFRLNEFLIVPLLKKVLLHSVLKRSGVTHWYKTFPGVEEVAPGCPTSIQIQKHWSAKVQNTGSVVSIYFFFFFFSLFFFDLQALINISITWKFYKVLSEGYFFAACIKTLSYAVRYHLNVIFRPNDLRIFEPIAQIWFHLTSKNQPSAYNSALKQNHCMTKCSYSVLWLLNRNSKARPIDQLNYRIQGLSFPYHWVTILLSVFLCSGLCLICIS